jgi:hypothetical protein
MRKLWILGGVLILALLFISCIPISDNEGPELLDIKYMPVNVHADCVDTQFEKNVLVLSWLTDVPCKCQVYYCFGDDMCFWSDEEHGYSLLHQFTLDSLVEWHQVSIRIESKSGIVSMYEIYPKKPESRPQLIY